MTLEQKLDHLEKGDHTEEYSTQLLAALRKAIEQRDEWHELACDDDKCTAPSEENTELLTLLEAHHE